MRGCCAATKVGILSALMQRLDSETNPDVRRGLKIAIYEIKLEGAEAE